MTNDSLSCWELGTWTDLNLWCIDTGIFLWWIFFTNITRYAEMARSWPNACGICRWKKDAELFALGKGGYKAAWEGSHWFCHHLLWFVKKSIAVVQKESFMVVGVFLHDLINLIRQNHQVCLVWRPNLLQREQGLRFRKCMNWSTSYVTSFPTTSLLFYMVFLAEEVKIGVLPLQIGEGPQWSGFFETLPCYSEILTSCCLCHLIFICLYAYIHLMCIDKVVSCKSESQS